MCPNRVWVRVLAELQQITDFYYEVIGGDLELTMRMILVFDIGCGGGDDDDHICKKR